MLSISSLLGTAALMTNSDDAKANMEWAEWFQGNYRLMSDAEKAQARARLERRYSREYGKRVTVDGTPALEGVLFGYALNIKKCIGCRRCAKACVEENNQSRSKEEDMEWIRVLKMEKGEYSPEKRNVGFPEGLGIQVGGNAFNPVGVMLEGEHYYQPEARFPSKTPSTCPSPACNAKTRPASRSVRCGRLTGKPMGRSLSTTTGVLVAVCA